MKAYRNEDGTVRLFRPDMNMARMNRVSLPPRRVYLLYSSHTIRYPDGRTKLM
jgi:hypothetical protein